MCAAGAGDLPSILAIINDAILTSTAWYDSEPWDQARAEAWLTAKQVAGLPVIVAEVDGVVAGFATYGPFRDRPAYARTAEHSVYVARGLRGTGIGHLLLTAIVEIARDNGIHTLIGGVDSENLASIAFHEAHGFVEAGRMREVGWKFDRWLSLVFMQRLL